MTPHVNLLREIINQQREEIHQMSIRLDQVIQSVSTEINRLGLENTELKIELKKARSNK